MRKYYKTLIGEKESIEEALKSQKEQLEQSDIIIRDENRGYAIYKVEELEKEKEGKAYHEIIHMSRNIIWISTDQGYHKKKKRKY